jgi:uncharacterized protein (DUF1684 family)
MRADSVSKSRNLAFAFLAAALFATSARADDDYSKSVETWRVTRAADLTKADGWLTLVGRHWLQPGDNTLGTALDNTVHLAAGPAHFGTVAVAPGGIVTFRPAADAYALIDGLPAQTTELRYTGGLRPSRVQSGTVTFYIIQHGGKLAARVKDSTARRRLNFVGLDYFPIDPAWRIEAQWVQFDQPRQISFTDVLGETSPASIPGKAVFTRDGRTFELLPIDEGADHPLFFVIGDPTNGAETHGGGRFLYAAWPKDGKVVLDFNHMENPPCAFTPFTICPLPPKDNQLPFRVDAGEKTYRGEAN